MGCISTTTLAQLVLSCGVCVSALLVSNLRSLMVVKALLRDGIVYVFAMSFPWLNKLHTGTIKLNYVLSPFMHACNMRACG